MMELPVFIRPTQVEHTMNGRRYFGEVHIVHYEDEYHNLGEALEDAKGDGVAVLGYFIDVRFVYDNQLG